jgi:hypothetical protein
MKGSSKTDVSSPIAAVKWRSASSVDEMAPAVFFSDSAAHAIKFRRVDRDGGKRRSNGIPSMMQNRLKSFSPVE